MTTKVPPEFESGLQVLDQAAPYLKTTATFPQGMSLLLESLRDLKAELPFELWADFCAICCRHPIRELVHQDPITYRSFSKPRGYAGDAVLLDFLYRDESANRHLREASQVGRAISEYQIACPSAESVRWRRELLAKTIDETAKRVPGAEILSVACGHLREAKRSISVRRSRIGRLVAFDQDATSLRTLQSEKNGWKVDCVQGTIKDLIRRRVKLGSFDLIYSAGLYDYLSDSAGRALTKTLLRMLKPDGRLLIANFVPGNIECGYMEAFMAWRLIYRTRHEFERMVGDLGKHVQSIFFDENRYVVYLELRKHQAL